MAHQVQIRMFGGFSLSVDEVRKEQIVGKSKKGLALLQYLILQYPGAASAEKLVAAFAKDKTGGNPEGALKTLISRFRTSLNQCSEGLGGCIEAVRGGYRFRPADGLWVDVLEFRQLVEKLAAANQADDVARQNFQRLRTIFSGELLAGSEQHDWLIAASVSCHDQYLETAYHYVAMLQKNGAYHEVVESCRFALEKDPFNERLHLELMQALVKLNRSNEAMSQYKHVTSLHFRYLGEQPPESIQKFYRQIMQCNDTLESDLDTVRRELEEYGKTHGAFECSYPVFREVYNLQMRNLARLDASMYVAMIMITGADGQLISPLRLEEIMNGLSEILCTHLRKGDTVTRFSSNQYCLLLPTVNDDTGHMVMERIKRFFYQRFPASSIMFNYRLSLMNEGRSGTFSIKKAR